MSLVQILKFQSQVYIAKWKKDTPARDEENLGARIFHDVPEDRIEGWLKDNSLAILENPFRDLEKELSLSNSYRGFLIVDRRETAVVVPKIYQFHDLPYEEVIKLLSEGSDKRDKPYRQRVIIRSSGEVIPKRLRAFLNSENYEEIKEF